MDEHNNGVFPHFELGLVMMGVVFFGGIIGLAIFTSLASRPEGLTLALPNNLWAGLLCYAMVIPLGFIVSTITERGNKE